MKKAFEDSELEEDSVIRNLRITAADGKTYDTKHYNLSAICATPRMRFLQQYLGLDDWKLSGHNLRYYFTMRDCSVGPSRQPVMNEHVLGRDRNRFRSGGASADCSLHRHCA
jgi:hypothetical protein